VADNGEGVQAANILRYFEKNEQNITNAGVLKSLGLVLCKEFVELNKGRIWLETQKGKGSKFFFTVPRH
jgi:light-regulated signal transduction histidine kinase (bacteriophytochrome)